MRKKQKARNAKIFVSWEQILLAKRKCEPEDIDKTTTVGVIQVPLQNVIDHQISKIIEKPDVREKYDQLVQSGRQFELVMYGKYGADGTPTNADFMQTADAGEY